jgi:hypothetical protein
MNEVAISFTAEEYRELAKLFYIGIKNTYSQDDYEYSELAEELMNKICLNGFVQIPESGAFIAETRIPAIDLPVPEFSISDELCLECEELENIYLDRKGPEYFVNWLSVRDFTEKYGKVDEDDFVANSDYFTFVKDRQTIYRQEFLINGVANLRLEK